MYSPAITSVIQQLQRSVTFEHSELEVAAAINELIEPNLLSSVVLTRLDSWRSSCEATALEPLLTWFREQGFVSSGPLGIEEEHSAINWALENNRGLPIVMGILVIAAARQVGMIGVGVNYPGHFMVRVDGQLVDPVALTVVADKDAHAQEASPRAVALRMLNNLKALSLQKREVARALDIADVQLAIADDDQTKASIQFERGEIWQNLGAYSAARQAFEASLAISPSMELSELAREALVALIGREQQLH